MEPHYVVCGGVPWRGRRTGREVSRNGTGPGPDHALSGDGFSDRSRRQRFARAEWADAEYRRATGEGGQRMRGCASNGLGGWHASRDCGALTWARRGRCGARHPWALQHNGSRGPGPDRRRSATGARVNIRGEVAVITGAASGIGRGTALALAQRGADIVIADINDQRMRSVSDEIRGLGRRVLAVHCDVSRDADVARLADQAEAELGPVGLVMNNAGVV